MKGCEILNQEVCPRQSEVGVRWARTEYNQIAKAKCPEGSVGDAQRKCLATGWSRPDLKSCLSNELIELNRYDQMLIAGDKKLTSKKSGVVAQLLHDSMQSIESRMTKRYGNDEISESSSNSHLFESDLNVTFDLLDKSFKHQIKQNSFNLTMTIDNQFNKNQLLTTSKLIRLYSNNGQAFTTRHTTLKIVFYS